VKSAFGEIVKADPACQACHADAKDLQRRAWLAEVACGLKVDPRAYWAAIREINDRYRARLKELWADFQCPYKDQFSPGQYVQFPGGAYRQGGGGPYEPQAGDLEFALECLGQAIAAMTVVFNTPLTLSVDRSATVRD
jgi:hypothetical protein